MFRHQFSGTHVSLVFNPLSGAVLLASDAAVENLPQALGEKADELGFGPSSVLSSFDQKLLDFAASKRRERNHHIFVQTTLACQLACVGCFEESGRDREAGQAALPRQPLHSVQSIMSFIREYAEQNALSSDKVTIMLFGGEPLTVQNLPFIEALLVEVDKAGYCFGAVTSAATMTARHHQLLTQYKHCLEEVDVTLEGTRQIHNQRRPFENGSGTFDAVVNNVQLMLDAGLPVLVKTNLGRSNLADMPNLIRWMQEQGWFAQSNFCYGINLMRNFGEVGAEGEAMAEDQVALAACEVLRQFRGILPKVRIEGLKLTRYLTATFGLLVSAEHRNGNLVDGWPAFGFCNPGDGTSVTIDPEGRILGCNWMSSKPKLFASGTVSDAADAGAALKLKTLPVIRRSICNECSIRTICGGGCQVDRAVTDNYKGGRCYQSFSGVISRFLEGCVARGWLNLKLGGQEIKVLSSGFDFNYRYEHRSTWE